MHKEDQETIAIGRRWTVSQTNLTIN